MQSHGTVDEGVGVFLGATWGEQSLSLARLLQQVSSVLRELMAAAALESPHP